MTLWKEWTDVAKNKHLLKLARQAVDASFDKGKLDARKVTNFIRAFKALSKDRAIYALENYKKGLSRVMEESTLTIYSPISLSQNEISKIKKLLTTNYRLLTTRLQKDPSLIGGLKFKIGDTIYDNSIKAKIGQIGEAIKI